MTVSLLEILAAARAHAAPLAAESAGYLLLAVADHVAAAPRAVVADDVELTPEGSVRLRARRGAVANEESIEQAVRRLLERTLEVSSSVGPALRRAATRRQEAGLAALVRELETALIPVNRSAARRALSRLYRETERARAAGKLALLLEVEVEAAPAVASVVVTPEPAAHAVVLAADFPEASPVVLPVVTASAIVERAPAPAVVAAPAPLPEPVLTLTPLPSAAPIAVQFTPEPLLAVGEPAFTKPEPVVVRAKERGSRTPQLGTLVTAQTMPGEDAEHTLRAPAVSFDDESELNLSIDVELEVEPSEAPVTVELEVEPSEAPVAVALEVEPSEAPVAVALEIVEPSEAPVVVSPAAQQPLIDPEPSTMPDVLTAMVALHTGIDADDAPTRIRDVVTELRVELAPTLVEAAAEPTPEPPVLTPAPVAVLTPSPVPWLIPAPVLTPEPQMVDDAWLTESSLEGVESAPVLVESAPVLFVSERVDPALHEAMTWDPGPVASLWASPLPPALLIAEPLPEPSPYAPAALAARSSDVSELVDSFHVTGAAEERELRSALKEMAGLSLTPLPEPIASEG